MASSNSDEILHDFSPYVKVYKDGRLERLLGEDVVPASIDPETGVESKDVVFNSEKNLSARLYLPKNADPKHKLPLLVYYHGGGFVIESPFSPLYQNYLNALVAEANVVAVSVDYRKAPEFPLPICYDDSWLALKWIASHSPGDGNEPWLKEYADLTRVYLGGESAGGNIVHNMAIRAGLESLNGININGIILNCPYFWGKEPIGDEGVDVNVKGYHDKIWLFANPASPGLDDPLINPAMDTNLSRLGCKRVLVYLGGTDALRHRGWAYKEALGKCGWVGDVEVIEVEGEGHGFSVANPKSDNAISMTKKVASFINH